MALALNRVDFLRSFRDSLIYKAFEKFKMSDIRFLYWYRAFGCTKSEKTGVLEQFINIIYGKEEMKCESEVSKENLKDQNSPSTGDFLGPLVSYFCDITGITKIGFFPSLDIINIVIKKLNASIFQRESVGVSV